MDPLRIFVALLIILSLSRIHQHFGPVAMLRPVFLLVMLAAAYAYLNPKLLAGHRLLGNWYVKIVGGLALMACLSVPLAVSIGNSGAFILQEYSKTLVLGILIFAAVRHTRDLYTFTWAVVIAIGALSYLSLFVFRMAHAGTTVRIAGGYTYDANDIGCVAVVGVPLTLLAIQASRGAQKLAGLVVLVGIGGTLAKTGSRGAFVGVLIVAAALLLLLRGVRLDKRIAFVLVLGGGIALFAPAGYWQQMETVFSPTEDYNWTSPTGRKAVFKRGVRYMMTNPATGIGIDNFARAEGTLSDRAREFIPGMAGIKWSAAHNSFLQVAAEMGVPGLLLFTALIMAGVIRLRRLAKRIPRSWLKASDERKFLALAAVYVPVSLIGFAASGVFVSFAYMDLIYVIAALAAATAVCIEQRLAADPAGVAVPRPTRSRS